MKEIERKFLVKESVFDVIRYLEPRSIRQGYIMDSDGKTVRVRTKGDKAFLTIKGKTAGISRDEFEYEIPVNDAIHLLDNFCSKVLTKDRFEMMHGEKKWEIDVFKGKLAGLIVAEIELESEEDAFSLPDWAEKEVSDDARYYNSNLVNLEAAPL
jgi:CYTH domain-containing protein